MKNIDVLNAILNGASQTYKDRIPEATQLNVAELGTAILEYEPTRNEFANALVNRIAFAFVTSKSYKNPLSMFIKGDIKYGRTVEEIFVDLLTAQDYDVDKAESELFKRVLPPLSTIFHTLNRQDFYKVTIESQTLRQAFLSEDGLGNVVSGIITSMTTSDEQDTYLLMKNLIQAYGTEGRFYPVVVTAPVDEQTVRQAVIEIKAMANQFTFLKTKYNDSGVNTHTPKANQVILIDPDFDARVDVELLAQAFNMSKAEFESRKVLIDDFGGLEDVVCILVDENWFQVYNNLYETRNVRNDQGLYENYFLHHWQTLSTSRFSNAVIFQTATPTLTEIDLLPATANISKKGTLQFTVIPTGTNNPPSKATYSTDGIDTYISPTGLMYVGGGETVSPITVTATSTFDTLITDTAIITVV